MKKIHIDAFTLGVVEELEKAARCWEGYEPVPGKEPYSNDSCRPKTRKKKEKNEKSAFDVASMPLNENILPTIENQAKWRYARTKDALKLSDGNLVYSFSGFPEQFPSEDFRVSRSKDDNILDFEKDLQGKGTAQIHRSSPDNIYVTLADGSQNPTFMLQHEEGQNWRYSPSKKFVEKLKKLYQEQPKSPSSQVSENKPIEEEISHSDALLIDPDALFSGGLDTAKKASIGPSEGPFDSESAAEFLKGLVDKTKNIATNYIDYNAKYPINSTLGRYAVLKGVDALRGVMNPDREMERALDPKIRVRRELLPIAGAVLPTIASMAMKTQ